MGVSPIEVSPRLVEPKAIKYPFAGGTPPTPPPPPIDEWWGLKLTMPEGGTVILRKKGNPNALSLEVSTDGENWQPWTLVGTDYSYTLDAGQTLCVRNTSEYFVAPSKSRSDYWRFFLDAETHASGSITSIAVNNKNYTELDNYCYYSMFAACTNLITAPELPAMILSEDCYDYMFGGCTSLVKAPELPATALAEFCYNAMFAECRTLSKIRTNMTDISALHCLTGWLQGVSATGDFYCPAELIIPSGVSGIPSGWTRHDI